MAKPYSNDLRERVVSAVEEAGLSRRQAAERFDVGISTVIRWVSKYRETGSVHPKKVGGNRPKTLIGGHRIWLIERCRKKDFTLWGLVSELAERGVKVGYGSVWDFVHAEGLSFKKNRASQRTGSARRRPKTRAVESLSGPDRP